MESIQPYHLAITWLTCHKRLVYSMTDLPDLFLQNFGHSWNVWCVQRCTVISWCWDALWILVLHCKSFVLSLRYFNNTCSLTRRVLMCTDSWAVFKLYKTYIQNMFWFVTFDIKSKLGYEMSKVLFISIIGKVLVDQKAAMI